jgi:predicted nuclease of predicted toxin-antitoxin system
MKILLDECVTKQLKPYLPDHEVSTVARQGWSGIKNGQLMTAAASEGFEVLLTIDKNFQHQQNIGKYNLIVVVLDSPSSKLEILIQYLPAFEQQLLSFTKGNAYSISL